ncbi:urea ABC transporter ATP-binding subunit UrtE [Luteolibacter yonseiensis]|uniref:Urea ABC transporter ATP-binding subunit UrtE n=1 Tax=Luteolibacter yonseiensis TaxID=1144680 RepID=A0A934R3N8_9BACT|nr:urea ABC transporter ATP-binding subunit UrtE [Luteolibacter yonseiensis]MBK1816299.1 urea ABC transporter ATP-binding subunit UrtE [Luteolibacter yonseiensis]
MPATLTEENLSISGLRVSIGGSAILRGIDLSIRPQSVFCLMGRNGVGKSTTLKALTGLYPIDSGKFELQGVDITRLGSADRARAGLGYVPQGRDIFPLLTVEENLFIGLNARGWKKDPAEIDRIFTLFPIIKEFLHRKGGMLSGGQQQQLAIGRALLTKPKLLILDEPTEGIQPNIIDQIGDAIKMLRAEGKMSILLVEQYLDFCKELGDDFAILERGAVAASGEMAALSDDIVREFLTV